MSLYSKMMETLTAWVCPVCKGEGNIAAQSCVCEADGQGISYECPIHGDYAKRGGTNALRRCPECNGTGFKDGDTPSIDKLKIRARYPRMNSR